MRPLFILTALSLAPRLLQAQSSLSPDQLADWQRNRTTVLAYIDAMPDSATGSTRCLVEHLGLVLSGVATVAFDERVVEMHPGDLFYVPPVPHDSWVVGDQPYVSLHFLGADQYAR